MSVLGIRNCYGCGLCATVCSKNIIDIRMNEDGFYEPSIDDPNICTDCGLCSSVCSFLYDDLASSSRPLVSYGAWSRDSNVRRKCSSGGVGFEIGKHLISEGYKVCGVKYNAKKNIAEHFIASSVTELIPSIGSKYIQSYTVNAFKEIKRKEKYLVTGTPCQIDSFRRYIKKFHCEDNFILMDFFCHGVPSANLWSKYCREVKKKIGTITYVSWRNKFSGWDDSWATSIDGGRQGKPISWKESYNLLLAGNGNFVNSRRSQGDVFFKAFLSDTCLSSACLDKCKYKFDKSSADIRIGDAWSKYYANNEQGVNAVICFTEKGFSTIYQCNIEMEEQLLEVVADGQLRENPSKPIVYNMVMAMIRNPRVNLSVLNVFISVYIKVKQHINRILHPIQTINNYRNRKNNENIHNNTTRCI